MEWTNPTKIDDNRGYPHNLGNPHISLYDPIYGKRLKCQSSFGEPGPQAPDLDQFDSFQTLWIPDLNYPPVN
jgi:hypothetical protein